MAQPVRNARLGSEGENLFESSTGEREVVSKVARGSSHRGVAGPRPRGPGKAALSLCSTETYDTKPQYLRDAHKRACAHKESKRTSS